MQLIPHQKLERFHAIAVKEPKLKELYHEIKNVSDRDIKEYGLITKMWIERFKPQFVHLVGPKRASNDELSTDEAYKLVYDTLFNALPYGNIDEEEYDDEFEEDIDIKSWYVHYLNY